MTSIHCRPQLSHCFPEDREERAVEISSLWAAEPPTPALDQSMLLHLQAMSGPARSAAHWRSTKEHIRLPTAAFSLHPPLFSFCSYFSSCWVHSAAFYIHQISSQEADEHGFSVSGLSVSLQGSLTVDGTLNSGLINFSAFTFALQCFSQTNKLDICCILLLLFLKISLFCPHQYIFEFSPCANAAKTIKSSTPHSCLQYVWTAREENPS